MAVGAGVAGGLAGGAAAELAPDDIVALSLAVERLKADASLIDRPDLSFFKDLIVSWGGARNGGAARSGVLGSNSVDSDIAFVTEDLCVDADAPAKPRGGPAAGAGPPAVMELGDDDDDVGPVQTEMQLPAGQLEQELTDEPDRDAGKAKAREEDAERLPKEADAYPALPPFGHTEPSDARKRVLNRVKQQAGEALARGGVAEAVEKYTEAIRASGASALMLATRAALLLKLRRPCAAIRDCCAALALNKNCGKAYHVRGVAHRRLGHWRKAHRDLSEGQRIDFSEDSVAVHMFVANKIGVLQNQQTGNWYGNAGAKKADEGAKKAVELLFTAEGAEKSKKPQRRRFRDGQAVRVSGLQKAPHLNGKRGIIQRVNPKDEGRWDVEMRLENGLLDTKAIREDNIFAVRAADAEAWKREEAQHEADRARRQKDAKIFQEKEERQRRLEERNRSGGWAGGFPDMDASEKLEAEMSSMPLDGEAVKLLRRLKAAEATELLQQVRVTALGGNLSSFVKMKVRQRLGEPDSDDEPEESRRKAEAAARAALEVAAKVEARVKAQKAAEEVEARRQREAREAARSVVVAEVSDSDSSEDEDFDRLDEEREPPPERGYVEPEPTEDQARDMARWKNEAVEALEAGDAAMALKRYSQVITGGGATALMLTKRGELLLKQRRPVAAARDCAAAIELNPDLGKAYRIRGIAHRKLGRWSEADRDLVEGQRLDYDEGTAAVQKFVATKVRKAAKRQRSGEGPNPKRPRDR